MKQNMDYQNGTSGHYPHTVHFLLNDKCNAKCVFCGGDYYRSKSNKAISLDKFKTMAANLQLEYYKNICLAGAGDPLLSPDFMPIVRYVNETYPNIDITVTTNGIGLKPELSAELLAAKVSLVNISINAATRTTYKRLMQVDQFDRVCAYAEAFVSERSRVGSPTLLQMSYAISRINIEELPTLVELAHKIGVRHLNIFYCRFYPEKIRNKNIESQEFLLRNEESLFFHQELSDRMVMEAKNLAARYGIFMAHEPLFREKGEPKKCVWTETELLVGFDGEVYPCGGGEVHFKEKVEKGVYRFGNALTQQIGDFWNNDTYRALRLSSRRGDNCSISECVACANLMLHTDVRSHIMDWEGFEVETTDKPLVSVIVPTFNRPDMLPDTLRSILDQTYRNIEIIVVNDAGADVKELVKGIDSSIVYLRHDRNKGLAGARNTGINCARGKYIAYLDDDDRFYPEHVETLVKFLESSEYKVAYTDSNRAYQQLVDGRYAVVKREPSHSKEFDYDGILVDNFIPVLCVMHEKSCIRECGPFDETLKRHEDWDLWIRMSEKFKFAHLPQITCEYTCRVDGSAMTTGTVPMFLTTYNAIYEKSRARAEARPGVIEMRQKALGDFMEHLYSFLNARVEPLVPLFAEGRNREGEAKLAELSATGATQNQLESALNHHLAIHALRLGDITAAINYLESALECDRANPFAAQSLATLRQKCGIKDTPAATKLKVAVFSLDHPDYACARLRLIAPGEVLADELEVKWGATHRDNGIFVDTSIAAWADLVVIQRFFPKQETGQLMEQILAAGKPVIYETDDLLINVPETNPHKQGADAATPFILDLIGKADAVTVSTEEMGRAFSPHHRDIQVLPNLLDDRLWNVPPRAKEAHEPVVIGYAGTPDHKADLALMEVVLERIAAKYGNRVAFRFMGCDTERIRQLPGFSSISFEAGYANYAQAIQKAGIDIGLVPLLDNRFNRCKSNIKWLEYSACGIAGVYADLPPYRSCVKDGETGLLVAGFDVDAWVAALERLIDNPGQRLAIALAARTEVLSTFTLKNRGRLFLESWRRVADRTNITAKEPGMNFQPEPSAAGITSTNPDTPHISIIIPLYNKVEYTKQCLEALAENTGQSLNYEVILVDNASTDGTADYLRTLTGNVTIISNRKNLGFAKANNQAVKLSFGRYLVFLNNDTIPHPGWLEALISGVEQDGADIVGAKLIYPNGRIQHAGVAFDEESIGYHIFRSLPANLPAANRKRPMQCVTAACMLVKREVFNELNGLDEAYVNGFEDVDFCLRAGERGRKILYNPESVLIHFEETSEGRKNHDDQNMQRYLARWRGKVRCDDNDFYRAEGFRKEVLGNGRIRLYQEAPAQHSRQQPPAAPPAAPAAPQKAPPIAPAPAPSPAAATAPAPTARELIAKGKALKEEENFEEALGAFEKALALGDTTINADMADCRARLGDLDGAATLYQQALDLNPDDVRALAGLGIVCLVQEKQVKAVTFFNKALKLNPADARALAGLGMVRNLQGKSREAHDLFARALDSEPESLSALHGLIHAAYALDSFADAEQRLTRYLMYHPADFDMLFSLAGLQLKGGNPAEALESIDKLLVFAPEFQGGTELREAIVAAGL